MAITKVSAVAAQVQQFWSPIFTKELRESLLLGSLVDKTYSGEIRKGGDTVKVSQVNAATGALKTVGTDSEVFASEALSTSQVEVKADRRAVAAYELEDLIDLQSQLDSGQSDIRDSLRFAVEKQINDYLYTLIAPDASLDIGSVPTFDTAQLLNVRKLASSNKWMKEKGWWLIMGPGYYNDLLNEQTLTSADFVDDRPRVGGQIVNQRFGFNIVEDNSRVDGYALAFHPDFMHLVMQSEVNFKISDLHPTSKFGFMLSVDIVFGAKLGINGAFKHINVTSAV